VKSKTFPFLALIAAVILFFWVKQHQNGKAGGVTAGGANRAYTELRSGNKTLVYSRHARCRMDCRHIDESEAKEILQDGTVNFSQAHPFFAHAYELEGVLSMVRLVYGAQVQFHNGDAEIVPGISVHHVGGHTLGLQVVRVWTRVGWVVLASDAAHYLANMTSGRPFPIVADVPQMIAGWERLKKLASRPQYIVPGHDPSVMQRYSEPAPSLRGVAVRLDAEPHEELDGTPQG